MMYIIQLYKIKQYKNKYYIYDRETDNMVSSFPSFESHNEAKQYLNYIQDFARVQSDFYGYYKSRWTIK